MRKKVSDHTVSGMRGWKKCLLVFFAGALLVSGICLVRLLLQYQSEDAANEALAEQVQAAAEDPVVTDEQSSVQAPEQPLVQAPEVLDTRYLSVCSQNSDIAAWLTAEGIGVDLPVMFTPDDPDHYLRLAFDGTYAISGCLFIGEGCQPDSGNIVVYGHNMNNESMFGNLDKYASEEFAEEHPVFTYDLIHEDGSFERLQFEVMTAFYSQIYPDSRSDVFRYYAYNDLSDPKVLREFSDQIMELALYDRGVRPEYGQRVLTLSTCSYHVTNGRFVVVACEIPNEAE